MNKIKCNVFNILIMNCNLKRHQETRICKNKALLTTNDRGRLTNKKKTTRRNITKDIMKRTKKTKQSGKIQCNICNSMITRNKLNRHQETEMCNNKSLLLNK